MVFKMLSQLIFRIICVNICYMNSIKNPHENHRQRFIDKFLSNPSSFAEHELLEILLYSVIARKDTNLLAHKLLTYFGNLKGVFNADVSTLMSVEGVGKKVATHIKTVGLIFNKLSSEDTKKEVETTDGSSFSTIKSHVEKAFKGAKFEKFLVMLFDQNNKLLSSIECTDKEFNTVMVSGKDVVEAINVTSPKYAIISHNHLTNDPTPSSSDDVATTKLNILLNLHDVTLSDHIILAKNGVHYSYYHSGRLQSIKEQCSIDKMLMNLNIKDGDKL